MSNSEQADISVLDHVTKKPHLSFADLMPRVVKEHGKSLSAQLKDIVSHCMRGNKLTIDEYYDMSLFDDSTYSASEKKSFVGVQKTRSVLNTLMEPNQFIGLMDDKLAYEKFNNSFGIASTQTVAIIGGHYPDCSDVVAIDGEEELAAFFASAKLPLFGKPVNSLQSLGSARFEKYNAAKKVLSLSGGKEITIAQLFEEITTKFDGDYLFQKCLQTHAALNKICDGGLPTIRMVTLDRGNGPELFRSLIKLTAKGNVADNFWRTGNMLAAIDVESGVMGKAITQSGIDGAFVENHPVTGQAIEGVSVPHWEEAKSMAQSAAKLLPNAVIIGFDIAITPNGPVIVEANCNPHLAMLQMAHRKGVLDEHMMSALAYVEEMKKNDIAKTKAILVKQREDHKQEMKRATARKVA